MSKEAQVHCDTAHAGGSHVLLASLAFEGILVTRLEGTLYVPEVARYRFAS